MRIGIDTRLQNESGVGRYIRNLVERLKRIDNKNEYILINPNVKWHTFKEQLLMPLILLKERLDLVHFPYFNVPLFYFGKFVVTIHDLTISHFSTGRASTLHPLLYRMKRMGYKFVLWVAIHRAEKIIVPTRAVRKEILKHYKIGLDKIVVIYEGVDKKLKIKNLRQRRISLWLKKLKLIKPKNYFLYVGNAYPHKNLGMLISVMADQDRPQAQQDFVEICRSVALLKQKKLVLVGKEDYFYRELKKKVEKLKFKKNIIFTGRVNDEELGWLYHNAIALLLPSFIEGFGLPALEAMASGCLVICSDIPALREICQDAAVYFNPQDTQDLAVRMREVVEQPKKYKWKVRVGLKRASEFSWEKSAQETHKIYNQLLSRAKP